MDVTKETKQYFKNAARHFAEVIKKKRVNHLLLILLLTAASAVAQDTAAQDPTADTPVRAVTFRFVPGNDMFYIPWSDNDRQLEELYALVDQHRTAILAGTLPVYVDGYCASLPTERENLRTAFIRANRVKSELITHKALKEDCFITKNHAAACDGVRDLVVVTLRIPVPEAANEQPVASEQPATKEQPARHQDAVKEQPVVEEPQPQAESPVTTASVSLFRQETGRPYTLALRTNLLYDALLMPTLGIEWRISPAFGIKLDGSLSRWGSEHGKVQKLWMLNPEVRWYLLRDKRLYAGISATYGEYNLYGYPLGKLFSGDTGYQGKLWGAGITVGYQLPLTRCIALDFNLGLGYTRSEYDSFRMKNDTRVIRARDRSKNFFGPTQAGISLIWTIGNNK